MKRTLVWNYPISGLDLKGQYWFQFYDKFKYFEWYRLDSSLEIMLLIGLLNDAQFCAGGRWYHFWLKDFQFASWDIFLFKSLLKVISYFKNFSVLALIKVLLLCYHLKKFNSTEVKKYMYPNCRCILSLLTTQLLGTNTWDAVKCWSVL